jgi:hypothetical protein
MIGRIYTPRPHRCVKIGISAEDGVGFVVAFREVVADLTGAARDAAAVAPPGQRSASASILARRTGRLPKRIEAERFALAAKSRRKALQKSGEF